MIFDSFLQDHAFLQEVNNYRVQQYYARIMLLDFETEHPITFLEGKVTGGSMNLNAGAATRRTGSLNLVFDTSTFDLTNPDNLIAINRKIKISIGIDNPFYGQPQRWGSQYGGDPTRVFEQYPPILYFPQGLFLITQASSSVAANRSQVTMQFIDKMGMLNGVCGGTIPASISLHDRLTIDGDGNVTVDYPRIRQIIREVVHHFGDEHYSRIIVSDVPDFGRRVVKWIGSTPIRFAESGQNFIVSSSANVNFPNVFTMGDDVGYMTTELTFPGELVKNAGTTVTQVLDDIVKVLGNYEYFYDIDGNFHFQQIRHFMQTGEAPLNTREFKDDRNLSPAFSSEDPPRPLSPELQTPFNINPKLDLGFQDGYLTRFSDDQFLNEFMNSDLVSSVNFNPQYANIKNSFVVWGTRQNGDDEIIVRYHLAIDEKPQDTPQALSYQWVWEGRNIDRDIVTYRFTPTNSVPSLIGAGAVNEWVLHSPPISSANPLVNYDMVFEWREELYRMALRAWGTSSPASYYDPELLAEWRHLYDPGSEEYASGWREHFGSGANAVRWNGYRKEVSTTPSEVRYWLDLIDTNSPLGKYSVKRIGRRTVVEEDNKVNEVLKRNVPNIVFIDGSDTEMDSGTPPMTNLARAMAENQRIGQRFNVVQPELMTLFEFVNSMGSCYEVIRNLLHVHLSFNASVTIQSIPILYLDVNKIVRLNFPEAGVVGHYIINRLSWNIGGNPRMSITANEAIVIV